MSGRTAMEPNWKPLENRLGAPRCVGFMFMGRVNGINLYKHGISRSYLCLDDDGDCYVAGQPGCYVPTDFKQEISKLECCLKGLGATLETSYDESFMAQKREALRQHGVSLLTIQVEPDEVTTH
jgi:hypothetical protein